MADILEYIPTICMKTQLGLQGLQSLNKEFSHSLVGTDIAGYTSPRRLGIWVGVDNKALGLSPEWNPTGRRLNREDFLKRLVERRRNKCEDCPLFTSKQCNKFTTDLDGQNLWYYPRIKPLRNISLN